MAGYIRQSSFIDGDTISASLFNNEYNQLLAAFNNSTGHKHDGTAAEGPVIALIGDAGLTTPLNKVSIDTSNNEIEFSINVGSVATEQFKIIDGAIVPTTDNDIDLGTSSLEFKDAYFDGTVNLDSLVIGSATAITDVDTDLTSVSASDDTLASAKAIKTYVDAQVATANELSELTDVNITSPSDGSLLFYDTGTSKWIDNVVSGDITIADTGVAAIGSGVIVNADINASAAIDATKIHDGSISNTEFGYLNGVTSAIQTQINAKEDTITGAATTITSSDLTASRALIANGSGKVAVSTVTDTELGYLSGVTSAIQTQIDSAASAGFAVAMAIAL